MSSSGVEKDLEEQLVEVGKKLQKPPTELDQLLPLLEVLENCLGRVEQSPSKSMTTALCPSMNSLVGSVLLKHSDKDVRLSVATCLSEITRITAPDAPYDDDLMKEIFRLIVATFEDLSDAKTPSFAKRVLILETVAKVRSCVVMLDLECDDLILEMFCHFFKTIREDHAECVFASMEGIMTVVLEESEDIPPELLTLLLNNMKTENQEVSPAARRLVEKVMGNCAAKLKPYLVESVKSSGISMKGYSKMIAQICEGAVENQDPTDPGASSQNLPDGSQESAGGQIDGNKEDGNHVPVDAASAENSEKAAEQDQENVSPEVDEDEGKTIKTKLSNGSLSSFKDDSSKEEHSPKRKSHVVGMEKGTSSSEVTPDNADQPSNKTEAKSDQATKKTMASKPNSLKKLSGGSDGAQTVLEGKTKEQRKSKKGRKKESEPLQPECPTAKDAITASESEKEVISEPVGVGSSAKNRLLDTSQSKRGRGKVAAHKGDAKTESEPSALPREVNTAIGTDTEKEETSPLLPKKFEKGKKRKKGADAKSVQRPSKKNATKDDENTPLSKSLRRKVKGSIDKIEDRRKAGESDNKKSPATKKSAGVALKEGEASIKSSSIKRTPGRRPTTKDETHGSTDRVKAYDESLVGSQIKVHWPLDKKFYEGTVVSYDPVKKRHKVSYVDGDEEELWLSKERWEYVEAEKQKVGHSRSGVSADSSAATPPPKKRIKTSNTTSRGKEVKDESSLKKRKETPPSKSKSITPKSSSKAQSNGSSVKVKSSSAKAVQGSESKGKKRPRSSKG